MRYLIILLLFITSCSRGEPKEIYRGHDDLEGLKIYTVPLSKHRSVYVARWGSVTSITSMDKNPITTISIDSNNILFENDSLLILKK